MGLCWECFWLFWGSDGGLWGHTGVAWPTWLWMRWNGVIKVNGRHNVISKTFQKRKGKGIYFGSFLVILGL